MHENWRSTMQGQISFGKSQISHRDSHREEVKAVHLDIYLWGSCKKVRR
ncbi:hypothetical protein GWK37_18255 [Bacillus velezensis]|nr:hypothetical protein GWK37_18255 [Bacillus velezensis]